MTAMGRHARRVPERIQDVLEALDNIAADTQGMTEAAFLADGKTQRAVIESLIVIGEAANRIMQMDPSLEQSAPALWQHFRDAYDMRIILTHEYFRVDAAIVWTTVQTSLPTFKSELLRS
jgi:uncharacterized protein with HEPN domain